MHQLHALLHTLDARGFSAVHVWCSFKTGEVCLDILKTQWTPAWTLLSVAQAISSMLADYNADSPLNCDAGNLVRCNDMKGFNSIARMYTVEYALPESAAV